MYALRCDFGVPADLLSNNALVRCHMNIDLIGSATIICPRRVQDTEYVWHPQPMSDGQSHINTYVYGNGKFRSVIFTDVVRSEYNTALIGFDSDASQTKLTVNFPIYDIYSITDHRLIFICGPKDLVLSDALQRRLHRLDGYGQMQSLPWGSSTLLNKEIREIGKGLGVFYINRGLLHLPLHGCGSSPSPLFNDSEVTVDPVTGIRSCVADPMSTFRIGFLCEGRIEPVDCMRRLLVNDDVVDAPLPYYYWNYDNYQPWVVARYFNDLVLPPFHGECRCKDPNTGKVTARMEIRPKTEYLCDITTNIFRDRVRPIRGAWCSVALHPGSTLTIKVPTQPVNPISMRDDHNIDIDEDVSSVPFSQLPFIYEYVTEFMPNDLTTLRQLKTLDDLDVYTETSYHRVLAGDALDLDVSQMNKGLVKLTYRSDKPLALIQGHNSFFYHWTLGSKNMYVLDRIFAIVNVSFAFTHIYKIIGCDRSTPGVFDQYASRNYCSTRRMRNGIGDTYECSLHIVRDDKQAGIYCGPDEELLPDNCDSVLYDLHYNKVMPYAASVRKAVSQSIRGFQVFEFAFINNAPLSYACICVDEHGYEKSRLVLESNRHDRHVYTVRREAPVHTLLPYILLPWRDAGFSTEWLTSPKSLILHNIHPKSVVVHAGTTLSMTCVFDPYVPNGANIGYITTTWLPMQPDVFYYTVNETTHGRQLIRKRYEDAVATTPGDLEVKFQEIDRRPWYHILMMISNKRGIIVSKDPKNTKYIPMAFVCGKAPEPFDLSISTGDVSPSDLSRQEFYRTTVSFARYTWHVVEVAVKTTDPYMQGCGVTSSSDELFKPETPQIYDADAQSQFGCKIDLQTAGEAAFYCPVPYVLDPPNCFEQVSVDGEVKNLSDISRSLVASHSNHFVTLRFDRELVGAGDMLRQTPPLECRCVTIKGIVLSTIQIENYYAK
ncbi:hypothetical protein BBBOND_0207880 [Babesia bigemina]|uniref:6-Cys domain-containing protein n=1 Tax=Babesia bigemina TaxID=5866 RepID=A0A061D9N6_BABBI|nr:hypothetical protein BBBOND_0207880 [Babesia bigemina]CDR95634.1 hypothetical protein BBBOND_0207880 [Babesia bigemina]|eukprot:XP_012767820.1 hypothetical protein BBBOND_0207880 [Babesia bigemina]